MTDVMRRGLRIWDVHAGSVASAAACGVASAIALRCTSPTGLPDGECSGGRADGVGRARDDVSSERPLCVFESTARSWPFAVLQSEWLPSVSRGALRSLPSARSSGLTPPFHAW